MNALNTLLARPELHVAVPSPDAVEALPSWLRFALAELFAQVLAGERHAMAAAEAAARLERTPEARQLAARQFRDERRHVAFFSDVVGRLGFVRPVDADVAALLERASEADDVVELLIGTHLVIETLGHAIFDATSNVLRTMSTWRVLSAQSRETLSELSRSLERLQRDESQHLAFGVLRLRDERAAASPHEQLEFDALVATWRAELERLFARLPIARLVGPLLDLTPASVLAHFDARAKAIGVQS